MPIMQDTDDSRLRQSRSGAFEMSNSHSAFQSQHSFARASSANHDHESLVKAAMEEAARHPERHRMTALPSKAKNSVEVIDVKKLTTSQKRLVLSRAMETSGQDNERLLNQIRQRQDRCDWALSVLLTALVHYLFTICTATPVTLARSGTICILHMPSSYSMCCVARWTCQLQDCCLGLQGRIGAV